MEVAELKYWIGFNRVSHVGRARIALLEGHFGSLAAAWSASEHQLRNAGLDRGTAKRVAEGASFGLTPMPSWSASSRPVSVC